MIAGERVLIMAACRMQFAGEVLGAELEQHLTINNLLLFWPCVCPVYVCFLGAPEGSRLVFMEAVPRLNVLFNWVCPLLLLPLFHHLPSHSPGQAKLPLTEVAITVVQVLNVRVLLLWAHLYGHLLIPEGSITDLSVDCFLINCLIV